MDKLTQTTESKIDRMTAELIAEIDDIYKRAEIKINKLTDKAVDKMLLDADEPQQRLKHAKNNGKDKVIQTIVDVLIVAGKRANRAINDKAELIGEVNRKYAYDYVYKKTGIDLSD